MAQQILLTENVVVEGIEDEGGAIEVRNDVAYLTTGIVNVAYIGYPKDDWVLVDAGLSGESRFGSFAIPRCIILMHGNFDHLGALETLLDRWDVPVYAHPAEFSFLNGATSYPPPNSKAGGGAMILLSPLFPEHLSTFLTTLSELPVDGGVPNVRYADSQTAWTTALFYP